MQEIKKIIFIKTIIILTFSSFISYSSDKKTVLFDESHGQTFITDRSNELDVSTLSDIFINEGWIIKTCKKEINDSVLEGIDALVISGAFKPIKQSEIMAIFRFMEKGGSLCVMLHIASPYDKLLHNLNVAISNSVIHEKENIIGDNDINFTVPRLKKHPLYEGIDQFSIYGAWALMNLTDDTDIIAQTSDIAWVDLNGNRVFDSEDAQQSLGVVAIGNRGKGSFVVFGDDAIFQNHFLKKNNLVLAQNLVKWLMR